jgi:dephospho-CoA kinase
MTAAVALAIDPAAGDNRRMTIIGLIGRIGAGKSTVARRFAAHGAHVIDADRIAHEVLKEDAVVQQVATRFGKDVLDAEGHVRRRAIADQVFGPTPAHAEALVWLESLIHPLVHQRIAAELAALQATELATELAAEPNALHEGAGNSNDHTPPRNVVVLDVPLLVQAGWADACDRLVVVTCSDELRRQRLTARQWNPAEQNAREAAWNRKYSPRTLPSEKISTVDASGDLAYTAAQVDLIWSGLSG